jgi:pyruvate dehydrogenase (quinone)
LGLIGMSTDDPEAVEPCWQKALSANRPCVLSIHTDPAVPPIPPHASWDQIQSAAESVLRGDSDRAAVMRQGLKAKIQEFLPGGPK